MEQSELPSPDDKYAKFFGNDETAASKEESDDERDFEELKVGKLF